MNSLNNNSREWLKVSDLEEGMQIAVPKAECFSAFAVSGNDAGLEVDSGDVLWDEIEEIRELPEEQVWDIEVEGTHNFVAGHLHPHADIDTDVLTVPRPLTEDEESEWLKAQNVSTVSLRAERSQPEAGQPLAGNPAPRRDDDGIAASASTPPRNDNESREVWFGAIFAHNTYLDGDVGIGTSTPGHMLHIGSNAAGGDVMIAKGALCVDDNDACAGALTAGSVYAVGAYSQTADYAEYFYSNDLDLASGEVVCVDVALDNAVKRCTNGADGNVMGIVSTAPAFTGNATDETRNNPHYKIIGMLGQLPTKVTSENGPIRPGDSLTSSAALPGFAMRANAGDSTVGVALQALAGDSGTINVLVSRRNKSLTVAQVEEAVVDRIAAMEIEDEVALLVSDAVSGYDFDPVVTDIIGTELALLEEDFDLRLSDEIAALAALIEANKLELIEEFVELVAVNTNLTVTGSLEASGGLIVPLDPSRHAELVSASSSDDGQILNQVQGDGSGASTTPPAFKVSTDGIVTAFSDFIISDGVNATSVKDVLAALMAPEMTKTELTVTQDLYVGNSFEVMGGQIAGATTKRPVFKIAADGTVSVREDIVLSGYTAWNDIPGIVSVFAYNTAADSDAGSWVAGARSASWYNEPLDATVRGCDPLVHDRCGSRSFPTHAVIAATSDTIYIFNAQDGSLWKRIDRHAELVSASGSDNGPITALFAADGALYLAQNNTVSIIDFKADETLVLGRHAELVSASSSDDSQILNQVQDDGSGGLISSNAISDLHVQRINSETYLAIAGDAGVDLINLNEETSAHYAGAVSSARLTASGDLFTVASSTLSLFTRAYNKEELAPDTSYTASSTLQGLYVTQDGNTAYTASGSDILVLSLNRHAELGSASLQETILKQVQDDDGGWPAITGLTVDEQAQVIYAAYQGGVKALALGDGSILATYESGETSWGAPWTLSGAVQVASLTISGPTREGELLSDTLVIATPNGLLARSGDYSLRSSLASALSASGAPNERSNRLFVTDEALFSGRVMVTDTQTKPIFAIDEVTGNTIVREDIVFSSDARMQSMPGVASVFVYDTTQDNDGGQWSTAFPQKSVLAAAGNTVHIYNSRTKELWGTYESSGIASIHGLTAKDGALAIYGDEGLVLVDLASGEEGELIQLAESEPLVVIAFSQDGDLYYAAADAVYVIRHAELVSASPQAQILKQVQDDGLEAVAAITGIALSGNTLYISHEQGITRVNLATGETGDIGAFGAVTSISSASRNTLLIAYQDEVAEITESGDIINTWTNEQEKKDRNNLPYLASSIASASAADGAYAIALTAPSGDSFVWMETQEQSLRDMLNAPKTVFTVIDRVQAPRIASVSSLSFTASSTISFYTGATSTPALVVRDNGDVTISGKVGMGTLDVAGDARFSSITSSGASLGTTTVSELKVMEGYFQMNALDGVPDSGDCDSADEYGRMAFDAQSETLYLCGPQGFRAFSPDAAAAPDAAGG